MAIAQTALAPSGKVFVHGEIWDAVATTTVPAGERVIVNNVDGLQLESRSGAGNGRKAITTKDTKLHEGNPARRLVLRVSFVNLACPERSRRVPFVVNGCIFPINSGNSRSCTIGAVQSAYTCIFRGSS